MLRRAALLLLSLGLVGAVHAAAPANAETSPVTSPIKAGQSGVTVGDATFTRAMDLDGNETLTVDIDVPGGITADHLCLSDSAFTSRQPPGSCAYAHDPLPNVTTDQFVIDLGTEYAGKDIYAQLHVVTGEETAYAGWQPGDPFFGNVKIDPVGPGVPGAPLFGDWAPTGIAAVFLIGIGAVTWRHRHRAATR